MWDMNLLHKLWWLNQSVNQSINPKRNQPWIFIERTDAETEAPILLPPDVELTHWKTRWCWERRRGRQRMRQLDSITNSMEMNLGKFGEVVKDGGAWCATVHGVTKSLTQLSDWTTTNKSSCKTFRPLYYSEFIKPCSLEFLSCLLLWS